MSSIANLAGSLLQSILPSSLATNNTTASSLITATSAPSTQQPDSGQLSAFAQLAGTLQQLQQSNPTQYTQITQQIATNLQTAAQTAQSSGNTAAAAQLNQLATDFTNASASGQLPNLEDLAKAVSGGHHAHSSGSVAQLLASLQSNTTQNSSVNAGTIIENTLNSAGISAI